MSPEYRIRTATLDDADVLVRHRLGMFTDMGVALDAAALDRAFRVWLATMMPAGTYRAWLVDGPGGASVAGGGITVLPWPPGPSYMGDRLAFVYNVYTEPAHRPAVWRGSSWTRFTRGAAMRACRRWRSTRAATASRSTRPWATSKVRAR